MTEKGQSMKFLASEPVFHYQPMVNSAVALQMHRNP